MSQLQEQYKFLEKIGDLPFMIKEGLRLLGTQEVKGPKSNPVILDWVVELNHAGGGLDSIIKDYDDDDIAWCGLWMAVVAYRRKRLIREVVKDPLWARNWTKYGEVSVVAELGDILVFRRNGGSHVGLYVGEDKTHYHVLGGNQKDSVNVVRIEKGRLIQARRPVYKVKPKSVKRYFLSEQGEVSQNER